MSASAGGAHRVPPTVVVTVEVKVAPPSPNEGLEALSVAEDGFAWPVCLASGFAQAATASASEVVTATATPRILVDTYTTANRSVLKWNEAAQHTA